MGEAWEESEDDDVDVLDAGLAAAVPARDDGLPLGTTGPLAVDDPVSIVGRSRWLAWMMKRSRGSGPQSSWGRWRLAEVVH